MTSLRPTRTLLEVGNGATDEYREQFELQIADDETLRICSPDGSTISLLRGVSASTWSAGTTTSSGMFLRSNNPNGESSAFDTSLGQLASCNRLVACARLTRYWMGPAFGKSAKDIPLDTQFLLVEVQEGGAYALFLPLLDGDFRASLVGNRKNEIVCHQESGDEKVKTSGTRAVYIGVGDDPYQLIRHSFAAVANETKTFATMDKKTIPSHVDEFGWCTWDAFYSEVTPQGVIEGVKSLREAVVKSLIKTIRDKVQYLHYEQDLYLKLSIYFYNFLLDLKSIFYQLQIFYCIYFYHYIYDLHQSYLFQK